jgi:hypothetical protein
VGIDNRSPWYEFSYYDRTGKLLWKVLPEDNYGGPDIDISYDGSLVFIADEETTNYKAQKWYLYDGKGKLIKSETHDLKGLRDEERRKERGEWIESIDISKNGKYIAYTKRGYYDDSKAGLMDRNGNVLWEKDFGGRHSYPRVYNNGNMKFLFRTKPSERDEKYLVEKTGNVIGTHKKRAFFPNVNYSLSKKWEDKSDLLKIYEMKTNKLLITIRPSDIFNKKDARISRLNFISEIYLFLVHYTPKTYETATLVIFDLNKNKVVWSRKKYHYFTNASPTEKELLIYEEPEVDKITRITAFEYGEGGSK